MPKPVTSDNFLAQRPVKERKIDGRNSTAGDDPGTGRRQPVAEDSAELARAQQRLAQEAEQSREPVLTEVEQARALTAELRAQISANPQGAMQAHRGVNTNLFTVATAHPNA